MGRRRIHLPKVIRQLDDIVKRCIEAETETDSRRSNAKEKEAREAAERFRSTIRTVGPLSRCFALAWAVIAYAKDGNVGGAMEALAVLIPEAITLLSRATREAYQRVRAKKRKKRKRSKKTGEGKEENSGRDPP